MFGPASPRNHVADGEDDVPRTLARAHGVGGRDSGIADGDVCCPKTDRLDAQWIARLAEMGLLRPSFVPLPEICALQGPDPHPAAAGPRPHPGMAAAGKAPGGCPGQAVIGGLVAGPVQDGPGHPGGDRRRGKRPAGPSGPGLWPGHRRPRRDRAVPCRACSPLVSLVFAVWRQYWLQLRPAGTDLRPSASEGRTYPKSGRICECSALSPAAGACRWPLLLLSAEDRPGAAPGFDAS
jgi:hypothetical protein